MRKQQSRLRETRQRKEVFKVVKETECHPSAEWIFTAVRKTIPNISLGTVYRNLSVLRDEGMVREIIGNDRRAHYDARTMPHAHFICDECGFIADVKDPLPSVDWAAVTELVGFEVHEQILEIRGRCSTCRTKGPADPPAIPC